MQVFCQIFSYENESFSGAVRVRKLESWKVSYGQEAKTGMCVGL